MADAAAKWFKTNCKSRSEGEHRDKCACFYWAFRAHTQVNDTKTAGLAIDIAAVLSPPRAWRAGASPALSHAQSSP